MHQQQLTNLIQTHYKVVSNLPQSFKILVSQLLNNYLFSVYHFNNFNAMLEQTNVHLKETLSMEYVLLRDDFV